MTDIEGKTQHLYKVLVIGDYAVGKTSIIKRYCEGYFTPNYKLTIGVDFAVKVVEWDDKTTVSLQACISLTPLLFVYSFFSHCC
jgi:Ras-related protein Rab-32